ncbi:MAG: ABC transporter substrate-binding protein [Candidatus Hodarchaeales archaeon]|jgi:ABC-type branched-subunit amino acid transport system substrate-binding protein
MKRKKLAFVIPIVILIIGLNIWLLVEQDSICPIASLKETDQEIATLEAKINQIKRVEALPSEIKIGGVFPITGRPPPAGRDRRDGFLMAIYEINNQTGANRILPAGVNLVPSVKDDNNTVSGGITVAQELITEGVDIVIGTSGSSVSVAIATELTPYKIPQISYSSSSPSLSNRTDYPYFMRIVASDADQANAIADLVAACNWTKGATIYSDDSYGSGLITYFTQAFESKGGTVLTDQPFATGASDVSAHIQAIKTAAPEFVLGNFIDADAVTVMKEARLQNIDNFTWIMTDGWSIPSTFAGDSNIQDAMQQAIGTSPAPILGGQICSF